MLNDPHLRDVARESRRHLQIAAQLHDVFGGQPRAAPADGVVSGANKNPNEQLPSSSSSIIIIVVKKTVIIMIYSNNQYK